MLETNLDRYYANCNGDPQSSDGEQFLPISRPTRRETYIDMIQLWAKIPFTRRELAEIERNCRNGLFSEFGRQAEFACNRSYLHRLQLRGPNEKALLLASTTGTVVNRVEFAGDLIFESQEDRDAWWRSIWQYHVQHHRRGQKVVIGKGVKNENGKIMYEEVGDIEDATYLRTAEDLWHPNYFVAYRDKICRITGEVWCIHMEIRTNKKKYVNRRGIFKPSDLIDFDVLSLLKEEMQFAAINPRILGRKYLNWKARKTFRKDAQSVGEDILHKMGSTQNVLDTYEDLNRLWECLIPISNSAVFDTIENAGI